MSECRSGCLCHTGFDIFVFLFNSQQAWSLVEMLNRLLSSLSQVSCGLQVRIDTSLKDKWIVFVLLLVSSSVLQKAKYFTYREELPREGRAYARESCGPEAPHH